MFKTRIYRKYFEHLRFGFVSDLTPMIRSLSMVVVLLCLTQTSPAGTIYVDSRLGNDVLDGTTPDPVSDISGPVRTMQQAVRLAGHGDTISLTNNGTPYYGSFSLVGERYSGRDVHPFVIEGNGSVLSGARPIEPDLWQLVATDVWRITPIRKAFYQLILDGEALPEVEVARGVESLPDLSPGEWCVWRGAIYLQTDLNGRPGDMDLALADEEAGLTLLDVHDVVVRNVVLEHYRLDGINAHDRCRNVLLENVVCRQNGRSGLTVAGTSQVAAVTCRLEENRAHSLLITEKGAAALEECVLDQEPTLVANSTE